MGYRTIKGNLAADPETRDAGSIKITTFRVIENTGTRRDGKFVEDDAPTTHYIEAKFELGGAALASLAKGVSVLVEGYERTNKWEHDGQTYSRRVLEASEVAPRLMKGQNVTVKRAAKPEQEQAAPEAAAPQSAEQTPF